MLHLRYLSVSTIPVEAECIRPDQLAALSLEEIRRLSVQHGNRKEPLGDFFDVYGDPTDETLRIEGDCRRVKLIGAGMIRGSILIEGDAGMHLGSEMTGGTIEVRGNAGDWVGAEMRGGRIRVRGNAGHLIGAAYRGARMGMRGGAILIAGNAENEVGGSMRRGLIAIGGNAGDFTGVSMIAGTILVGGRAGQRPGAAMKRGTIAFFDPHSSLSLLPSFRYDCEYQPNWLNLYLKQLQEWGYTIDERAARPTWRRYSGDLVTLGKGEILQRLDSAS